MDSKEKFKNALICAGIGVFGVLFFAFSQIRYSWAENALVENQIKNRQLQKDLGRIDQYIYKESIRNSKNVKFPNVFFELSALLPSSYEISSFKFLNENGRWVLDTYVLSPDDKFYESIPKIKILKTALIEDFIIDDHPSKHLRIEL